MARVDYERMAAVYDRGRGLPLDALKNWRAALKRYIPQKEGLTLLDLGSGTGRFATALATWLDARVVGVEPAEAMRRAALRNTSDPRVSYVAGCAETIPLRDESCDAAWLAMVIHHFLDLSAATRELRRVLRPNSPILIRGAFPDRDHDITLFRFFPNALHIFNTFPTTDATIEAFAAAGFAVEAIETIAQVSAPSLRDFRDRVRVRADSTLEPLSDEEFARGMAMLDEAIARENKAQPVIDRLDLLVLR